MNVANNLKLVRDKIASACQEFNRDLDTVDLLAVSKRKELPLLLEAAKAGQRLFGENYIQEAESKIPAFKDLVSADPSLSKTDFEFHFIGHLQRNKAKKAVELFDVIQTVDSLKLAEALAKECEKASVSRRIFIQVNISGEESKSGVMVSELPGLLDSVVEFAPLLKLEGLMAIGSDTRSTSLLVDRKKGEFEALVYLRDRESARLGLELPQLSMGMSSDLEEAVRYGSTMLRVGTDIFGAR